MAAAVLVPGLVLVLLELVLRVAGYGYPTAFFIRHSAAGPDVLVENQRFSWRFFPRSLARHPEPILTSPAKPAEVCRIFVLGESAAEGDPAPPFGFSRILRVLLEERYPGTRFEVINVAFTAINSHVILPIARECERLEGDLWLVYMGNNEVIGPFGTGTIFGTQSPPLPVIRAGLALKSTRTGQLLEAAMRRVWAPGERARGWAGMTMFMSQQVRRDDPRLEVLRGHFRSNLRDIIAAGSSAQARIVVSTMVCRLRDWPPFGSLHRADLSEEQRLEWDRIYAAGVAAETAGDMATAVRLYEQAAQLDTEFADLQYRWGRGCLALGQLDLAKRHLTLARDFDTLRFRTDSRLNELIRQIVAESPEGRVRLLEAEQAFDERSPDGIPGEEWFFEHVHFTFAGNYVLARLFAQELTPLLPPSINRSGPRPDWPTEAECAARLGFTDSQRYEIANVIRRRFSEPIYRQQLGYEERFARVEQDLADLRVHAKPAARGRAVDICRQALETAPNDWVLHELTARLLGGVDDYTAAEAEWREVIRLVPHAARAYTELGKLERLQGNNPEAIDCFRQALEVNPDYAEALAGLGTLYRQRGRLEEAKRCFQRALDADPTRQEAIDGLKQMRFPGG